LHIAAAVIIKKDIMRYGIQRSAESEKNRDKKVKKKILIVDDEIVVLKSLHATVVRAGYEVAVADNDREALAKLTRDNYNLVIIHIMKEDMGGVELLAKVRKYDPEMPVIVITSGEELHSMIEDLPLGVADYLFKPYKNVELLLRIRNCLEKQMLQKKVNFYENIIDVCSGCIKIKGDAEKGFGKGDWKLLMEYLKLNTDLDVSHSTCPECTDTLCDNHRQDEENKDKISGEKK